MSDCRRHILRFAALLCALACLAPAGALAQSGGAPADSGGAAPTDPALQPPGKAKVVGGLAVPPPDAPPQVVGAINAANSIASMPYRYGGGHAKGFDDTGYDCSGAVSKALSGGGLLAAPLDSKGFMTWGEAGKGRWITVYTNPGHAYVVIAGVRFDTGGRDRRSAAMGVAPGKGPRWAGRRSSRGYVARHPVGF